MVESILRMAKGINSYPYAYIFLQKALSDEYFLELEKNLPTVESIINGRNDIGNIRFDRQGCDLLKDNINDPWRSFIEYHTSREFWLEFCRHFGDVVRFQFPELEHKYGPMRKWETGLRGRDDAFVLLECQIGLNTVSPKKGRVRGPHLDNPKELAAGLLYFRHPNDESVGGDFLVQEYTKQPTFYGKAEIHDGCVSDCAKVPFRSNNFAMFVNGLNSCHAVSPRSPSRYPRRLVNFAIELNFPLFSFEKYRTEERYSGDVIASRTEE